MCNLCVTSYKPPPIRDGSVTFGDWPPIRNAIVAAYKALGQEAPSNIPVEVWNIAGLAIDAYRHGARSHCIDCHEALWPQATIRCLDCKAPLCENCAPKHFWPDGKRPRTLTGETGRE